jgi:hypothetical protein
MDRPDEIGRDDPLALQRDCARALKILEQPATARQYRETSDNAKSRRHSAAAAFARRCFFMRQSNFWMRP